MSKKMPALHSMTPSWDLYMANITLIKERYVPAIYLVLLPSLIGVLGGLLAGSPLTADGSLDFSLLNPLGVALLAAGTLWQIINIGPLTVFQLETARGQSKELRAYYQTGLRYDLRLLAYYIVFVLLVFCGLLLFIIPGLFVIRRYFLGNFYIVDKRLPVLAAMKACATSSKRYSGAIWGVIGIQVAVMLATEVVQVIPVVGIILAVLLSCSYIFLAVLRYREIEQPVSA
jgi:hypothetical protein